jgi:hypothetical protein
MGKFSLVIKTGNSAFEDDCRGEIARILEDLVRDIRNAKEPSCLIDYNGNKVRAVTWDI